MTQTTIPGGYYLKARRINESAIAIAPPHVREIWDWLLREANHSGRISYGTEIKRGQCFTDYKEIQEGLQWKEGFIKKTYKKHHVDYAMRWLRQEQMVTTQRTTRGLFITICNYDFYQDPKNYAKDKDYDNQKTGLRRPTDTVHKNGNNVNNENTNGAPVFIYSNKGFYDKQLQANEGKDDFDKYKKLVEFLHQKDDDGHYRFKNVLGLPKQIGFSDYKHLKEVEKEYSLRNLKDVLEEMENKADLTKKYSDAYLTANSWLKKEFPKKN